MLFEMSKLLLEAMEALSKWRSSAVGARIPRGSTGSAACSLASPVFSLSCSMIFATLKLLSKSFRQNFRKLELTAMFVLLPKVNRSSRLPVAGVNLLDGIME